MLLLRLAVASLRGAGSAVALLAPPSSGRALIGPGPAEVERVIAWDDPRIASLFTEGTAVASELREELVGFDIAVVYSRNQALAHNLASLVTLCLAHDPTPGSGHAARWLAQPLVAQGIPLIEPPPVCVATAAEEAEAAPWLQKLPPSFLAIHPGSGSPAKNWPADRFRRLAEVLADDAPWLLVQGPAEEQSLLPARGAIRAHDLDPRILGAILRRAGVFVGNDSGVSHLAAAWGAPTLALFGPTDPAVWAPVGPRVRALRARDGRMESIEVAKVAQAARDLR